MATNPPRLAGSARFRNSLASELDVQPLNRKRAAQALCPTAALPSKTAQRYGHIRGATREVQREHEDHQVVAHDGDGKEKRGHSEQELCRGLAQAVAPELGRVTSQAKDLRCVEKRQQQAACHVEQTNHRAVVEVYFADFVATVLTAAIFMPERDASSMEHARSI